MDESNKRKASPSEGSSPSKKKNKNKNKKQWFSNTKFQKQQATIDPRDVGIWATCVRGKEGKSTIDLSDLFDTYATRIYPDAVKAGLELSGDEDRDDEVDIEASITAEVSAMRHSSKSTAHGSGKGSLFQPVKLDTPCVLFFKTQSPVEPVSLVSTICRDKASGIPITGCKFVKRLTPMLRMEKATEEGLESLCRTLLTEESLGLRGQGTKYAIRPTIRDHSVLKRDALIKQTANAVGNGYVVDLKNPDKIILVEVYRNICGIAVVSDDYLKLNGYNLAELHPIDPNETIKSTRIQSLAVTKRNDSTADVAQLSTE